MADPDWVPGVLEPSQNLQIWMKMDKNPILRDSEAVQNFLQIRHWAEMRKKTNPDEPFLGLWIFGCLIFVRFGSWVILFSRIFDIWS